MKKSLIALTLLTVPALAQQAPTQQMPDLNKMFFEQFDTDKDGRVSKAEFLKPTEAQFDASWWQAWERADLLAAAAVETVLGSHAGAPTGMQAARAVAAVVPEDGQLFLAASSVVRFVGSFAGRSLANIAV